MCICVCGVCVFVCSVCMFKMVEPSSLDLLHTCYLHPCISSTAVNEVNISFPLDQNLLALRVNSSKEQSKKDGSVFRTIFNSNNICHGHVNHM